MSFWEKYRTLLATATLGGVIFFGAVTCNNSQKLYSNDVLPMPTPTLSASQGFDGVLDKVVDKAYADGQDSHTTPTPTCDENPNAPWCYGPSDTVTPLSLIHI